MRNRKFGLFNRFGWPTWIIPTNFIIYVRFRIWNLKTEIKTPHYLIIISVLVRVFKQMGKYRSEIRIDRWKYYYSTEIGCVRSAVKPILVVRLCSMGELKRDYEKRSVEEFRSLGRRRRAMKAKSKHRTFHGLLGTSTIHDPYEMRHVFMVIVKRRSKW